MAVAPADLRPVGVVHHTAPEGEGVDVFFVATRWAGEPTPCAECDEVRRCAPDALPAATIPFVRRALERHLRARAWFDQDGWA